MCENRLSNTESNVRDIFINNLCQQISEFELLKSMYPDKDEIVLTDSAIIRDIENFMNNKTEYTPSHLDYTLNLHINNMKLEMCINLPTMYPEEEPDIYIRCNELNRQQETKLNSGLLSFIKDNHSGEVCLYTAISWVQDNIDIFTSIEDKLVPKVNEEVNHENDKYVRMWIFSHHIYNKKKREEIVKKARELDVHGFCLPGKPGIICIEGINTNCNEWWKDIKSMSWKKITLRNMEELDSTEDQKFTKFEEISFRHSVGHSGKHADMSEFSKYMDMHGLSQAFNDVFRLSCSD